MVRWLSPDEMLTWRAWLHASTHLMNRLDSELRAHHDLTLADYEILSTLSEAPGDRMRMSDLAARALISKSRLTYRIDRLVGRGLVVRETAEADGRGAYAALQPAGRELVEAAAVTHVTGVRDYLVDPLGKRRGAEMATSMHRVLDALDETIPD